MSPDSIQTYSQLAIFIGLLLAALGGYGNYWSGKQISERENLRLQFLADRDKEVRAAGVRIELRKNYVPEELGHFGVLIEVLNIQESPHPTLWFGVHDSYATYHHNDKQIKLFQVKNLAWSRNPDEILSNALLGAPRATNQIVSFCGLYKRGPFITLGDFDRCSFSVFVTKSLLNHVTKIRFMVDSYILVGTSVEPLHVSDSKLRAVWPDSLPNSLIENDTLEPWAQLHRWGNNSALFFTDQPSILPWEFNFSAETPKKIKNGDVWSEIRDMFFGQMLR